jgi:hypothetical protein
VVCKPRIRATARVGDWIAGTGSKYAKTATGVPRDLRGRLVYAMRVSQTMTMREYDAYTQSELPGKVPDWSSVDPRRRVGDSLYDFSNGEPVQRKGVHSERYMSMDLSGENALVGEHFYYFGTNAIELPPDLRPIAQNQQGHRVRLNESYRERFVAWLEGQAGGSGIVGEPLLDLFGNDTCADWCAAVRAEAGENDRELDRDDANEACAG